MWLTSANTTGGQRSGNAPFLVRHKTAESRQLGMVQNKSLVPDLLDGLDQVTLDGTTGICRNLSGLTQIFSWGKHICPGWANRDLS